MKFIIGHRDLFEAGSLSARRAWIEIHRHPVPQRWLNKSLSARRAWIEMSTDGGGDMVDAWSLSARRAWIEINF